MIIQELVKIFRKHGIKKGDTICVHSDITSFGIPLEEARKRGGISFLQDSYIETFKHLVGKEGTLIMPTFTYSACNNRVYNPFLTPSIVGVLTDRFRKQKGVKRALHPIFAYAAWGKDAEKYVERGDFDCFGEKSIFQKFYDNNVKFILFGVDMERAATFVLYTEQKNKVPYRYNKKFYGDIRVGNSDEHVSFNYFVRNLKYDYNWKDFENKCKIIERFKYMSGIILLMRAKDIDKALTKAIKKDAYGLAKRI